MTKLKDYVTIKPTPDRLNNPINQVEIGNGFYVRILLFSLSAVCIAAFFSFHSLTLFTGWDVIRISLYSYRKIEIQDLSTVVTKVIAG